MESLVAGVERINFRFDSLEERRTGYSKISASNTDHGSFIFNTLQLTSNVKTAAERPGAEIIIPLDVIGTAVSMRDTKPKRPQENALVNLYTPYLAPVVKAVNPELELVNSEHYKWLRCMSGHRPSDMMPDLFSAHHSLVQFRGAYENAPVCAVDRLFGKFINWESRASIHCIWDAKWAINMEGFGEKCKYLQIAGEDCVDQNGVALKLKGVLFDVNEFWMIRSSGNTIVDLVQCKWSMPGSKQHLFEFLRGVDPWIEAATALCNALNVNIRNLSNTVDGQSAILGAGANGRAFKLTNDQVIKIVIGRKSDEVEREFNMLHNLNGRAETLSVVFPVISNSYRSGSVGIVTYAGYLLSKEGTKITLPLTTATKIKLADSLYKLHLGDVIHGDPRIENALLLDGEVKWIDFRQSQIVTTKIGRRRDVQILYHSIGGLLSGAVEVIETYVNNPSSERLSEVLFTIVHLPVEEAGKQQAR
jgi:hypothetical protein